MESASRRLGNNIATEDAQPSPVSEDSARHKDPDLSRQGWARAPPTFYAVKITLKKQKQKQEKGLRTRVSHTHTRLHTPKGKYYQNGSVVCHKTKWRSRVLCEHF